MMSASQFYATEAPTDIMQQVASMLDFLSEALSGMASNSSISLSSDGLEGLSTLCLHLGLICQEAAAR